MADFRTRFREADRIDPPDMWPDIMARRPGHGPPAPGRSRLAIAALALMAGVGVLVLARAFLDSGPEPSRPIPPTGPPSVPPLKENGRIAFTRIDPDTVVEGQPPMAALYTVNLDGTGLTRLTEVPSHTDSAWSPDGSMIAFMDGDTGGISVMDADGTRIRPLTSCDKPGFCTVDSSPSWAPDGNRIAFFGIRDADEGIYSVAPDGTDLTVILSGFVPDGGPVWSPAGQEIAVSGSFLDSEHHVGPSRIHIVDAQTGDVVRSFRPKGRDPSGVAWSPDGNWLAFRLGGPGGRVQDAAIYLVRPDGSDLQLLTSWSCPSTTCSPHQPTWSPDGRQIVFTGGGGELGSDGFSGDLLVIDVDTKEIHRLTTGPSLDCCPAWQPVTST
jgi:Tol biopolymer transport system component